MFLVGLAMVLAVVVIALRRAYLAVDVQRLSLLNIFHISPAVWNEGEVVTLEVDRCKRPQMLTRRFWSPMTKLVYFFPQRPTSRHARGQNLAGRTLPRYLYEMELLSPVGMAYERNSAIGVPHDLTVRIVARQALPATRKSRRGRANESTVRGTHE